MKKIFYTAGSIKTSLKCLFIFIFLFSALACGSRKDIKPDSTENDTVRQSRSPVLSDLEETLPGYSYDDIIEHYQKILPAGFSVTKYKYFVIFSELDDKQTAALIENDVNNTSTAMTGNYVQKMPDVVTPIILFNEFDKYKKFVLDNYDIAENDLSPYGFYKISKNVIIIRYVSWKGSILHEITHRFIRSDFPDIPSWFDEGFASLHEKSTFVNGSLRGEFSWRIIPIRRAFENNSYTGLKVLMETNDDELYGQKSPYYYAQSRYLLMMLQEKELLKDFYVLFKNTYSKDETGISQLEKVTKKSLAEIDGEFVEYIKSFK